MPVHARTRTHVHTRTQKHMHGNSHIRTWTYLLIHVHTTLINIGRCTQFYTQHTSIYVCTYTQTYTDTGVLTHTQLRKCTYRKTHARAHTLAYILTLTYIYKQLHIHVQTRSCTHLLVFCLFLSPYLSVTRMLMHIYMLTHTLSHTYMQLHTHGLTPSCTLILCDTHTLTHTRIHIHLSPKQHTHAHAIDYHTLLFQQKIVSNRIYEICILHLNLCHKSLISKEFFFVIYRKDL